jgi:hypothetical protein
MRVFFSLSKDLSIGGVEDVAIRLANAPSFR